MTTSSMTGFARAAGSDAEARWAWEARSVNGKGLDVRLRLPPGRDRLEAPARERAGARFARGNLTLNLTLDAVAREPEVRVNEALLSRLIAVSDTWRVRAPGLAPVSLDGLLAVRGVVEVVEPAPDPDAEAAREAALLADLDRVLDGLATARAAEGTRLAERVAEHLERIAALTAEARTAAEVQTGRARARLREQVAALLDSGTGLSEERLAQEAALIAAKGDVTEELDRLDAHVAAARDLMAAEAPKGRRLDFLCQEFNREANTLCAKAQAVALTRLGLELKAAVEQLREQIQNVE